MIKVFIIYYIRADFKIKINIPERAQSSDHIHFFIKMRHAFYKD